MSEISTLLLALSDKLQKADSPSRALDAEIHNLGKGGSEADLAYILTDIEGTTNPPAFTSSLDDALTLVPDDHDWIVAQTNGGVTIHAEVGGTGPEFQRFGETPALALASAALLAMSRI